jgi:hypothetical protein
MLGTSLMGLKFLMDYSIARAFDRTWSVSNYIVPTDLSALQLLDTPGSADVWFFLTMLAAAMPFVVIGTWATYRRLQDAKLPRGLTILFFVPVINLLMFGLLSIWRSDIVAHAESISDADSDAGLRENVAVPFAHQTQRARIEMAPRVSWWIARWLPESDTTSPLVSGMIVGPVAPLVVWFGVSLLKNYGWGLFVGMPFVLGFLAAVINGLRVSRPLSSSLYTAAIASVFGLVATFLFAIEGLVCLIFLVPLAMPVALVGGLVGHVVQAGVIQRGDAYRAMSLLLMLPIIMGAERALRDVPSVYEVSTSVDVDAPPEMVWPHVIAFSDIAPPTDWFFRSGAAYPIRARIEGHGVGAIRYCEFSTGPFVEPIIVWDEPRLLRFTVTHNPPPLRELSLFSHVHPPHLEHFLKSHEGQFALQPLPGGRTRVTGTTRYEHGMWPQAYWRLWTDWVIHKIHRRVLEHVRDETIQTRG